MPAASFQDRDLSNPNVMCAPPFCLHDLAPIRGNCGLWRGELTCDQMVTYCRAVSDDDLIFKALADSSRRFLLDLLFARDGRTLTELESELEMSRFGVMKHLRILENAGLVATRKSGREKLHFLNPVPIRLIHDRWTRKYAEPFVSALVELKADLEETKCRPSRRKRA